MARADCSSIRSPRLAWLMAPRRGGSCSSARSAPLSTEALLVTMFENLAEAMARNAALLRAACPELAEGERVASARAKAAAWHAQERKARRPMSTSGYRLYGGSIRERLVQGGFSSKAIFSETAKRWVSDPFPPPPAPPARTPSPPPCPPARTHARTHARFRDGSSGAAPHMKALHDTRFHTPHRHLDAHPPLAMRRASVP